MALAEPENHEAVAAALGRGTEAEGRDHVDRVVQKAPDVMVARQVGEPKAAAREVLRVGKTPALLSYFTLRQK